MKKIAMIGPELYPIPPIRGGASELWIEKASRALKKYRTFIFSPTDPDLPKQELSGDIQYFRIPVPRFKRTVYSWFKAYLADYEKKISPLLIKIDPDIIHVHNRPLLIPFFRKRFPEKRIVFHMHNVYEYLGRLEKPNGDFEIQTDLTLACSRFLLDREKNRLGQGAKRLDVIYNGVEPEVFRPSWDNPAEADGLRRQYGLEGKKVVLYTGKIRESKGVMVLFSAMKQVFLKDPTIHLVLAGGTGFGYKRTDKATDFSERLQKEIRAFPDRVTFIRFTQPRNMPRIYLLGDIFAAPSQLEEALGMVFLEASACGLPVIGTSQGGIPEVIRDQETGLLLREKDNVEELSDKILFLLRNPDLARRMGEKGRQLMMNYFSWDKIAQRLESSYDDLLAQ